MQLQSSLQVPEQFSSVFGLGTPVGVYPVSSTNRWISAILGVILVGGAGLAVIYGFYDASVQSAKYGPAMFGKAITTPLIAAAIMFIFGLLAGVNAFLNWNKSVVVYEKGLGYSDNKGVQTWSWQEVDRFYVAITKHYHNGIYTGTTYLYTLQKTDGSRLKLDNKFKQVEALGRLVSQKVAPHQYEKLLQQLRSGQTVMLGPISIRKESITFGKKSYAWEEVEQVGIQRGYVNVKKAGGGWFSGATAPVAAIPNLDALFAVVDQIVKVKAK